MFNINKGGKKTVPLAEVVCVHAELRSLTFETFQTKYWSGIKAHTHIDSKSHAWVFHKCTEHLTYQRSPSNTQQHPLQLAT